MISRYDILSNRLGLSRGIGEDPGKGKKPLPQLTYEQRNKWSEYAEKNPQQSFDSLWAGFQKSSPKSGINRDALKSELDALMAKTQQEVKRDGSPLYPSAHTGYSFPKVTFNGKDYGRVNALMQTQTPIPTPSTAYPQKLISKQIPSGVTNFWFDEEKGLIGYEDPWEGVIKYAEKQAMYSPEMKRVAGMSAGIIK